MTHFALTWPNGLTNGTSVPTPAEWADVDTKSFKVINGDAGGQWYPSAPLILGGAGLRMAGPGVTLSATSGMVLQTAPGKHFVHADNDYFQLAVGHGGRNRTLATPVGRALGPWAVTGGFSVMPHLLAQWFAFPIRVHNGATLASVTFTFSISEAHANVPDYPPRFRVYAVDAAGTLYPLKSTAGADVNGYAGVTAASGSAYSALTSFTYACDQNNVIDLSRFDYFAEVVEEDGGNTWTTTANRYTGVTASLTGITDMRPQ